MKRLLVLVVFAIAIVARPMPANAAVGDDGWVWDSTGLRMYPRSSPVGPPGAVIVPSTWSGGMCQSTWTNSTLPDVPTLTWGKGSQIHMKCYLRPWTGGEALASAPYVAFQHPTTGLRVPTQASGVYVCHFGPHTEGTLGYLEVLCGTTSSYATSGPALMTGLTAHSQAWVNGITVYDGPGMTLPRGVNLPPQASFPTHSGIGNTHPFMYSTFTGDNLLTPQWPRYWPVGVTPSDEDGPSVGLPDVTCQGFWRDGKFNVAAHVNGDDSWESVEYSDEFTWAYEWEIDPGEEADQLAYTPRQSQFWSIRPDHDGRSFSNLTVPTEGVPPGGWTAVVRVDRTIFGDVDIGRYTEHVVSSAQSSDDGWSWDAALEDVVSSLDLDNPLLPPVVREANLLWALAHAGWGGYQTTESDHVGPSASQPTSWRLASGYCPVPANPANAGTPAGDTSTRITPHAPGEEPDDEGDPGNESGNPGCQVPQGWSMLNPIAWASQITCVLGPLFDLLGDLLQDLIDAIGDLFDWLKDAFMPSGDYDWGSLVDQVKQKAPWVYIDWLKNGADDLVDQFEISGGDHCVAIGVDDYEECAEVPTDLPGTAWVKAMFALAIWVGVGTRIVRSAPWARGQDSGEPG